MLEVAASRSEVRVVMLEVAASRSEVRVVMLELWLSIMDLAVSRSTSSAEILYWSKVVGADDGELVGLVVGALVGSDGELVVGAFDARTHSADDSEPLSLAQAVFHGASVQSKQAAL